MRASIINKTPQQWLVDQGLQPAEARDVLRTFELGARVQVCRYGRGSAFYRFQGKAARRRIFEPNCWLDASAYVRAFTRAGQFEGTLTDAEIARIAKQYFRELAAISHVWGESNTGVIRGELHDNELWKIELLGDETVEGVEGAVAGQPTHHATKTEATSSARLAGGALQVFLNPRTPFVCTPIVHSHP